MPPKASPFTTVTACTMDCPDGCSLIVSGDANGRIRIKGNPDHPYTAGFTCAKIKRHAERLKSADRLRAPMLRDGTTWRPISWDRALDLCAEKIARLRKKPLSILHIHGDGAKGVLKSSDHRFFSTLGATGTHGSLCDAAGNMAYMHDFGSRTNHDPMDLLNARHIVNWGKDLSRSSVHTAALVRKASKAGSSIVTISPGGDGNGPYTDTHLRIRPGTDRFLAAAVIRRFIDDNMVPHAITRRIANWPAFRELIWSLDVSELTRACDVEQDTISILYEIYRSDAPAASLVGAGLQRYGHGAENVRFINALALISGNIGIPGGGSYYHLNSLTHLNMQWQRADEQRKQRTLRIPTLGRDILSAEDPPIEMIWANGGNIVNQAPGFHEIAQAFRRVEFIVVVDAFMTDTAARADLVLPCALMLEQEDIVTAFGHTWVQYIPEVLKPPSDVRSDYQILKALGQRLEPPIRMPETDTLLAAALDSPAIGVDLDTLREKRFYKIETPRMAYKGLRFDHPDGLARLATSLNREPPPPEGYPMRLLSLIRGDVIHSQMLPHEQQTPPRVWVSPESPHIRKIDMNAETFLTTPQGRLRVQVETSSGIHPETIIYRRGDWTLRGGGINQLIRPEVTDMGEGTAFYNAYARLEN